MSPAPDLLHVLRQYYLHRLPPHHVRQERHLAGALDRGRGLPLVLRAQSGDPSRPDLAPVEVNRRSML